MKELASAIPSQGHDHSTPRTAVGKLMFMAPWRPVMQFAIQQLSTQVRAPTTESRRAVKQLLPYFEERATRVYVWSHMRQCEKTRLNSGGRNDSDRAGSSATRQSITGLHCHLQGVMICNRSLTQTVISLHSCEAQFYAASACAAELLGLAELFKELHLSVSLKLEMDSDSARHVLQRRGPGGLKHIEVRCLALQQWIRDMRLTVGRVATQNNTAGIFTKYLNGPRILSLSKKLGLHVTGDASDVALAEQRSSSSRSVRVIASQRSRTVKCCLVCDLETCTTAACYSR